MRHVLWILSLVVVAGFAFSLRNEILRGERTPPSAPSRVENPAVAPTPVPDATVDENPLPAERTAAPDRGVVAEGLQRVRVVATLPDGSPAVAAVVRYRVVPDPSARYPGHRGPVDLEAALAAAGRAANTDDGGCVAIDVAPSTGLCVRCGEHYGEAAVSEGAREIPVALQHDLPLRVQVLDTEGRPRQGLRVEAEVQSESRREGPRRDEPRLTITDADGVAVMPHAQLTIALPGPEVVAWSMLLRCDLDPVVERVVTAAEVSTEQPLVLRVPAGGAIAVETVDADGAGMWAGVTIEDIVSREQRGGDRDSPATWFRQLPLGRTWTVIVSRLGHEVRRELVGPTRVDEVVRTRIELPLRGITVRGRIVRPDGVPVPLADIRFTGPSVRFLRDTEESRDGSLGHRIGDFSFGGVLPADVAEVTGAALHVERKPYCLASTIPLAQPLRAGENDLGDVVVSVAPDEVLLASVEVRAGGRNVTSRAWAYLCGAGDERGSSVSSILAEHGERITFRGPPTSRPLAVDASCPGCLGRRVPVCLGDHVVVELEPAASLAVHLLLPPVPAPLWIAELIDVDGHFAVCSRTDGGFECSNTPPGRYGLRILVDGQLVHEVRALDLVAGDNEWPPDGPFDLRDRVRAFHVDIAAVDGAEVEWYRSYVLPVGRSSPEARPELLRSEWPGYTLQTRSPRWFVPRPQPVDLAVVAPGFVPVCLTAPSADTKVRLTRCTALRVHVARGERVRTIVRVIEDGVKDPWLRALDEGNLHGQYATDPDDELLELWCAPGTVVEVVVERSGVEGAPQRVAIGREAAEITAR